MKIAWNKVGRIISVLGILSSLFMINCNLIFKMSFSYVAITIGFVGGYILLKVCTKKK